MENLDISPDYQQTARFLILAMVDKSFVDGTIAPMISLLEHIRYLDRQDPATVDQLITWLQKERGGGS